MERRCKACNGTGEIKRKGRKKKKVKKSFPSFAAPGPKPIGDHIGDTLLQEGDDEELSYLVGSWRIFQKLGRHRYSTDDLVTSWVACNEMKRLNLARPTGLDIGCGLGSVLLCNAWQLPDATLVGIEAQEERYKQAVRSVAYNVGYFPSEQTRVQVLHGDLRADNDLLSDSCPPGFDLVTGTPPYFAPHLAGQPGCIETAGCLFELRGGVEEYCSAAARYLRQPAQSPPDAPPSVFVLVNTALASSRVYLGCEAAKLSVVRRLDVVPRVGKPALFCVFVIVLDSWLEDVRSSSLFPSLSTPSSNTSDIAMDISSDQGLGSYRSVLDLLPPDAVSGLRVESSVRGETCEVLTVREANLEHTIEYAQLLRELGKPSSFDREIYSLESKSNDDGNGSIVDTS